MKKDNLKYNLRIKTFYLLTQLAIWVLNILIVLILIF